MLAKDLTSQSVSFLQCFPYFELLSLCVGVRGSSWWLMQQSGRRSLCQNVSEKQVAGVSINPCCPPDFFVFFLHRWEIWMAASWRGERACTHTHAHMHAHTAWQTHKQLDIHYLWNSGRSAVDCASPSLQQGLWDEEKQAVVGGDNNKK